MNDFLLRIVFNRIYTLINEIKIDFKQNKVLIANNRQYFIFNFFRKLKLRYQTIFNQFLNNLKHRHVFVQSFWWISINIAINNNDEIAIINHVAIVFDNNNIIIYTNENEIKNNIEISTIWTLNINDQFLFIAHTNKTFLNIVDEYTIYSRKLYDIIMTLKLIKNKDNSNKSIFIFMNNQTTIRSIRKS